MSVPALPVSQWPEAERRRWLASATVKGWTRDSAGFAKMVRLAYGRLLALAGSQGRPLVPCHDTIQLWTRELENSQQDGSVLANLEHLAAALPIVRPGENWGWFIQQNRQRRRALRCAKTPTSVTASNTRPTKAPRVMPIDLWPARDRERWMAALLPPVRPSRVERYQRRATLRQDDAPLGGPVADAGRCKVAARPRSRRHPSEWSASYCRRIERGYGLWLNWQVGRGTPGAPVTPESVADFIDQFEQAGSSEISLLSYLFEIWRLVTVIEPEGCWRWLEDDWRALKLLATPRRDKRLNVVPLEQFIGLGLELMDQARSGSPTPAKAIVYRDGLLIALAGYRPKRARNLAELRLGSTIVEGADGDVSFCWLDSKNSDPSEATLPYRLQTHYRVWLDRFRPLLEAANGDAFWLSQRGNAMSAGSLSSVLARHTKIAFGCAIRLHRVRSLYSTSLVAEDPQLRPAVSRQLDHRDKRSIRAYELDARSLGASKALDRSLEPLREDGEQPTTSTRTKRSPGRLR